MLHSLDANRMYKLLILHRSPAYQSNCLQMELLIDYELLQSPKDFSAIEVFYIYIYIYPIGKYGSRCL